MNFTLLGTAPTLFALGIFAYPASARDSTAADIKFDGVIDDRPANVPPDFLATPHGYFHPSCVIEIRDDQWVDAEDNIVDADGSLHPIPWCLFPHYHRDGAPVWAPFHRTPTVNGWVIDVNSRPGATSWISAYWTVPASPPSVSNQIVYFFPGLEPQATYDTILQPVLGWNQIGNGASWTIASWNCCRNGNNLHSSLVNVNAADNLYGYVWGTNCNAQTGVCNNWQILTSQAGGNQTTLNTDAYGEVLNWDVSGVLEAYNVSYCNQYPASGTIVFSSIVVHDINGATIQPTWSQGAYTVTPACNATTAITSSSATINWCSQACSTSGGPGAPCGLTDICGVQCACASSLTCSANTCVCPSGRTNCGGTCVDLNLSASNCGTCGHHCTSNFCSGGSCYCTQNQIDTCNHQGLVCEPDNGSGPLCI